MKKEIFTRIFSAVCVSFPANCKGCPFKEASEKNGCASCGEFYANYQRNAEQVLAEWIAGGTRVAPLDKPESQKEPETRREILQSAERCVCGDRDVEYGEPQDSFELIARLWEPIIRARCVHPGAYLNVDAVTVALLMAELKIARASMNTGHMESWVDGCGYLACGGEIAGKGRE